MQTRTLVRHRWPAVVAALAAAAATAACDEYQPEPAFDTAATPAATERAVQALEADSGFRQQVTRQDGWRPLCTGRPLGSSPETDTVDDVRTVYAWVYCKWVPDTRADAEQLDLVSLPGLVSPVAVYLGPNLLYEVPEEGENRAESISSIFPESIRKAATDGIPGAQAAQAELDQRITREFGIG